MSSHTRTHTMLRISIVISNENGCGAGGCQTQMNNRKWIPSKIAKLNVSARVAKQWNQIKLNEMKTGPDCESGWESMELKTFSIGCWFGDVIGTCLPFGRCLILYSVYLSLPSTLRSLATSNRARAYAQKMYKCIPHRMPNCDEWPLGWGERKSNFGLSVYFAFVVWSSTTFFFFSSEKAIEL